VVASWDPIWEYDTTFTDSVSSIVMTPGFRTTSTDADLSANLTSFTYVSGATAPGYSVDAPPDFVTGTISVSSNFSSNATGTGYPGSGVITAVAAASDTPVSLPTIIIFSTIILMLSLYLSYLMRENTTPSVFIKGLLILACVGICVAIGVFDDWLVWIFGFTSFAIVLAGSQRSVEGTGYTGNNMLGFLTMAWLGMTVINRILEGQLITSAEKSIINNLTVFTSWDIGEVLSLPVPNIRFLTTGLPALMRWDYSYFGGNAQIFQYMMYSITAVVTFILLGFALGAAANVFSRARVT